MSSSSTSYSGGILTTQFDMSKLFIWNNRYETATYTNPSGSAATLTSGTLMGRVIATNKILPQVSTATDGSQVPIGILKDTVTVAGSATVTLTICVSGDVASEQIIFGGSDLMTTPILFNSSVPAATTTQYGTIYDILVRSGIRPITSTDNTIADN